MLKKYLKSYQIDKPVLLVFFLIPTKFALTCKIHYMFIY